LSSPGRPDGECRSAPPEGTPASGGSWVLLRGLTRDARHWGAFAQVLGKAVAADRVIALDLPGNGTLHRLPSPTRVEAMADHARAELQRRGVPAPWHLVAMSLGAMVACAWAGARPAELAGAVLINTSLRPFSRFTQRLRPRNYAALLRLLVQPSALERERTVLRLTSRSTVRSAAQTQALLAAWAGYRRDCPVSAANALRQLAAAARYRVPGAAPGVPMLVLSGAGDGLVDPRCSSRLAHRWSCPIAVHPWAGHDLALDDGPWVAAQVAAWHRRL
jgi:pimeloyl-ACP methyl ester carboxylesterase